MAISTPQNHRYLTRSENKKLNTNPAPKIIASHYPAALIRLCNDAGHNTQILLSEARTCHKALNQDESFIPIDDYHRMIASAYRLTDDPALGLNFGLNLRITSHGMLGFAALASIHYGDAIRLVTRYFSTRLPVMGCHLEERVDGLRLSLRPDNTTPLEARRFLIESIFASLKTISQEFIGPSYEKLRFDFDYATPSYLQNYNEIFGSNIRFRQKHNSIHIPYSLCQSSLKMADPITLKQAEQHCRQQLENIVKTESLSVKIIHLLRTDITEDTISCGPDMEAISQKLNISPRTLRRKLNAEATTYQQLIDNERTRFAKQLLNDTHLSITEIASRMNFSDSSYFAKAFKKWTGMTPSVFRNQIDAHSD